MVDGILDACDDIRAVGGQSRPVGAGGQGVAGGQVVQPQRRGGSAQVDGGGAACLAGGDGGGIQRLGEDAPAGGGGGVAGELNWQDLLRVDAGSWYSKAFKGEPLPLLSQVAERCREHGMMANIEIKPTTGTGPLTGKMVALAARQLWAGMTPPLLSSFEIDALEAAQLAAPELPRGLLLDEWRDDWRELTARLGCVSIHLNHKLLDKVRVMQLKDAGLRILVYTVNKPQRAAELLRWGVDCICTDAIDVIGPNFTAQ